MEGDEIQGRDGEMALNNGRTDLSGLRGGTGGWEMGPDKQEAGGCRNFSPVVSFL